MAAIGNRKNSALNGLWAKHAKKEEKRRTSKARRKESGLLILE